MNDKIMVFRPSTWYNMEKNCPVFGIQAKIEPKKWLNCCNGKNVFIFDTEEERDNKIKELRKAEENRKI